MGDPSRCRRLAGRMEGVTKTDEAAGADLVGQRAGDATAEALAPDKNAAASTEAGDHLAKPACQGGRGVRPRTAGLHVGKLKAGNRNPTGRQTAGDRRKERVPHSGAGTVGEHQQRRPPRNRRIVVEDVAQNFRVAHRHIFAGAETHRQAGIVEPMESPHDRLWRLVAARDAAGADVVAIDEAIHAAFATTCAVVFTDLVGFSRHTERFGILAFLTLIHRKRTLLADIISAAGGAILKHEADSWLIVFREPDAALDAMISCHRRLAAYNVGLPEAERIELCVGIGYGEVLLVGNGDVWGREVNAASRLGEDTACGGEILVSEAFRQAVAGPRPLANFEALATTTFPGPCWRFAGNVAGETDSPQPTHEVRG